VLSCHNAAAALFYGLLAVIVVYCYYYSVHKHSGYICQLADQRGNAQGATDRGFRGLT
jgi:hypothetical protein